MDVKLSRDGHVVVMHDRMVDRTTDGTGRVADLSLAHLKTLDAGAKFSPRFTGERIPTLDEVIVAVPPPTLLNIELTNYGTIGDGLEGRVAEAVRRHNAGDRVILSSFHPLTLRAARRASSLPLALLTGFYKPLWLPNTLLAPLIPHSFLHPQADQVTPSLVARAHRNGKRLNVWIGSGINETESDVRSVAALGIDGIITNVPGLARRAIASGQN